MGWWNLIPNSPCRIDSGQCRFRITSYANFTAFEQRLKIFSISSSLLALSLDKPVLDRSRTGWRAGAATTLRVSEPTVTATRRLWARGS